MQEATNYSALAQLPGMQDRLLAKQLVSFERLLSRLQDILCALCRWLYSYARHLNSTYHVSKSKGSRSATAHIGVGNCADPSPYAACNS